MAPVIAVDVEGLVPLAALPGAALQEVVQQDRIKTFETAFANDGALILKFWMHPGRKEQK